MRGQGTEGQVELLGWWSVLRCMAHGASRSCGHAVQRDPPRTQPRPFMKQSTAFLLTNFCSLKIVYASCQNFPIVENVRT